MLYTRTSFQNLSEAELLSLYISAKDAYYKKEPIMSDADFDYLEKYLGLENQSYVGAKASKSNEYTVKHSLTMGSLAKVHTDVDKHGVVDYKTVADTINNRLHKANAKFIELTPKFDGCSFSVEVKKDGSYTAAQRGDGQWGPDIKDVFTHHKNTHNYFNKLEEAANDLLGNADGFDRLIIRGEVLVNLQLYTAKYADKYANSRVFVSGNLNTDSTFSEEQLEMWSDLEFVCFDYRLYNSKTDSFMELSWMNKQDPTYSIIAPYLGGLGKLPDFYHAEQYNRDLTEHDFEKIYNLYNKYRNEECEYALDGIVVKPEASARTQEYDRENNLIERPQDCIAVKFIVEILESVIEDIEWTVGKTGECYPKAIVAPVYKDGKRITRASLHGYSSLLEAKAGIGSKVKITLSGDIIPDIYEVLTEGTLKMPDFETEVVYLNEDAGTPHLMKVFTEEELEKHMFITSVKALKISGIAEKTAEKLWDDLHTLSDEPLTNLMQLMCSEWYDTINEVYDNSKTANNIVNALETYRQKATLADIVRGFCFEGCGEISSEVCARILSGISYDTSGITEASYSWALNKHSRQSYMVMSMAEFLDVDLMTEEPVSDSEQIWVIMTGDPSKCTKYDTKAQWLNAHPQYKDAKTNWSKCQILFTNDLNSKTSKMQKATKLGIEIKQYID